MKFILKSVFVHDEIRTKISVFDVIDYHGQVKPYVMIRCEVGGSYHQFFKPAQDWHGRVSKQIAAKKGA